MDSRCGTLRFLDANCGVGPFFDPHPGLDWSVEGLLARMDEAGIAESCVHASSGVLGDLVSANRHVAAIARKSDRLHPVWHIGSHHVGEFPAPAAAAEPLAEAGVRMLRLCGGRQSRYADLELPLLEDLLGFMNDRRMILYLDWTRAAAAPAAAALQSLLRGWPSVPVIIGVAKTEQHDRLFYALWERFGHFYVELSGYQGLGVIEEVTRRFGGDRLVFGTRYPQFCHLQTVLQVRYSHVDERTRELVAGGTLRRLLDEVTL